MLKHLGFTIASYCLAIRLLHLAVLCSASILISSNKIKVEMELFFILLVLVSHYLVVSHMHFCRYDCFTSIG